VRYEILPIILSCLYCLYFPCIVNYLHLDGYMCTIICQDIRTLGEWYLKPQTSREKAFEVLFTPPHQVFGGFWMFRGLITVGTYVEYTDPVSFISFRTWILSTGGLGLGLLPSKQGGWPRPFGGFHLRSGTGGTWKSGGEEVSVCSGLAIRWLPVKPSKCRGFSIAASS